MKKSFQLAAVLVAAMLGACSGGDEKNAETAVTVIEKPTVKLASVSSRDVEQIARQLKKPKKVVDKPVIENAFIYKDLEEKMISIYNLLYTIKDVKSIKITEFLINVSNSFKEKWGI